MKVMIEVSPFLGRMVIEIEQENIKERLDRKLKAETGVSDEFLKKFEVIRGETVTDHTTGQKRFEALQQTAPINRGKIVKMSPDCFGTLFQQTYGSDREYPGIGDTVIFIPYKSYQVDPENRYHILDDNDIVGWIKQKVEESTNE